jgi:hypothetical protein
VCHVALAQEGHCRPGEVGLFSLVLSFSFNVSTRPYEEYSTGTYSMLEGLTTIVRECHLMSKQIPLVNMSVFYVCRFVLTFASCSGPVWHRLAYLQCRCFWPVRNGDWQYRCWIHNGNRKATSQGNTSNLPLNSVDVDLWSSYAITRPGISIDTLQVGFFLSARAY